jgi:hypothetical protein
MNDGNRSPHAPWPAMRPMPLSAESVLAVWRRDVLTSQDQDEFLQIVLADRDGVYLTPLICLVEVLVQRGYDWVRKKLKTPQEAVARLDWSTLPAPPPAVALTQTFSFSFNQQQPVPQAAPPPGFNLPWPLSDAAIASRKRRAVRLRRKAVSPARPAAQQREVRSATPALVTTEPKAPTPAPVAAVQQRANRAKRKKKRPPAWEMALYCAYVQQSAERERDPLNFNDRRKVFDDRRKLFTSLVPQKMQRQRKGESITCWNARLGTKRRKLMKDCARRLRRDLKSLNMSLKEFAQYLTAQTS